MYACITEIGGGFFNEACGQKNRPLTFHDTPTTLPFANCSMLAPCPVVLATANLYSLLQYLVLAISRQAGQLAIHRTQRGGAMQDGGYELRRILLPRTRAKRATGVA